MWKALALGVLSMSLNACTFAGIEVKGKDNGAGDSTRKTDKPLTDGKGVCEEAPVVGRWRQDATLTFSLGKDCEVKGINDSCSFEGVAENLTLLPNPPLNQKHGTFHLSIKSVKSKDKNDSACPSTKLPYFCKFEVKTEALSAIKKELALSCDVENGAGAHLGGTAFEGP